MSHPTEWNRREFHNWSLAALAGVVAGATAGCSKPPGGPEVGATPDPAGPETVVAGITESEQILLTEPHVCRGLNTCKGLGKGGENSCAGMGACASMEHACAGENECKGQGGCGSNPGMNACKGQGGCHIPLMEDAWTKARSTLETAMKKQGKEIGAAPAKTM